MIKCLMNIINYVFSFIIYACFGIQAPILSSSFHPDFVCVVLFQDGDVPRCYRLMGIVKHKGQSSDHGHYFSYVYSKKTGHWYLYDDEDVKQITEEYALTQTRDQSYIFFYMHK